MSKRVTIKVEPTNFGQVVKALSDGLDLCVRARGLDEKVQRAEQAGQGMLSDGQGNCLTPALWVVEQYDKDLAAWEESARALLRQLPEFAA